MANDEKNHSAVNIAHAGLGWGWLFGCCGWLGGVGLQLQQRDLWPVASYGLLALLSLLIGVIRTPVRVQRWPDYFAPVLSTAIASALLGFAAAGWQGSLRTDDILAQALEGVELTVVGVVSELPKVVPGGVRFQLSVESAQQQTDVVRLPSRLTLGWYAPREKARNGHRHTTHPAALASVVKAGQRWQFNVRLKRPHGLMNPHGFDYELYLLEHGVGATGYVRETGARLLQDAAGFGLQGLRQQVKDSIEHHVPDGRVAGVLAGLAVGDQSAIDREDWALFRAAGIAHLVSISGLHVTMFAWLTGALIRAFWRRRPRGSLWLPAPAAARWGGLVAAFLYALFSGWGLPAQRTVLMLAAVVCLQTGGRRWPWPLVLLASAVVVTVFDPWALLQPGFWLSFVAVGLLLACGLTTGTGHSSPQRSEDPNRQCNHFWLWHAFGLSRQWVQAGLRTQVIATLGLAPLSLVFFQQLSVVGLLANLVAVPVVSFLITPLALAGAVLPLLWVPAAALVQGLSAYLSWLAAWPGATWLVAAAPLWAQCAGLLGAAVAVLPIPWRLRVLALPLCLPLCFPVGQRPPHGQFDVLAADVGQGTAVLIRTQQHLLVFDAGPQYAPESDAGERVLVPLLQALGERRIDALMLSHSDTDHIGGAASLMDRHPVGMLHSSLPDLHSLQWQAKLRGVPSQRCVAGQSWRWDGVDFLVLHPEAEDFARPLRPNAMSCVVQVRSGDGLSRALLTGDIERRQEERLLQAHGEALRSNVLMVPHHGSKTSSSAGFMNQVRPDVAIVQSGYRNRFGHPAPEVVRRLLQSTGELKISPTCGAWRWSSQDSARAPKGQCWRIHAKRYWHSSGGQVPEVLGANAEPDREEPASPR